MALTSRDIVAAEAHYHLTCYSDYTRVKTAPQQCTDTAGEDNSYEEIESKAFEELFDCMRNDLLVHPQVMKMASLMDKLISKMKDCGMEVIKDSTKKHITRKIKMSLEIFCKWSAQIINFC